MTAKICVVGSSNIDQIAYVKVPADGETVFVTNTKWVLVVREQIKQLCQG